MNIKKGNNLQDPGIIWVPWVMKEHTDESLKDYDEFMAKYHKEHEVCPKCGGKEHTTTLMGYPMYSDARELYRDLNDCKCHRCGDVHTAHERVPKKI